VSDRLRRAAPLLLLLIATVVAFAPALDGAFVWDDEDVIVTSPLVNGPLGPALTKPFAGAAERGYWRPLVTMSFWANRWAGGLEPWHFHLTNVVLHVLVVVVAYFAFRAALPNRPFATTSAALLFAVHPANTESVAWVVGRTGLMACLFALPSVVAGVAYLRQGRSFLLGVAATFFVLALWCKENAVIVPALTIVAWAIEPDRLATDRRRLAVFFVVLTTVASAWLGARWYVLGAFRPEGASAYLGRRSVLERLPVAAAVVGRYVAMALAPVDLLPCYGGEALPARFDPTDRGFLVLTALTGMVALVAVSVRRREPAAAAGLCWFLVALAPVSHLFVTLNFTVAARCLYLPLAGLALAVGIALDDLPMRSRWSLLIIIGTAALLCTRTDCRMWADDVTLWQAAIARRNGMAAPRVHVELGLALLRANRPAEALEHLGAAECAGVTDYDLQVKMARAADAMGRTVAAVARLGRHCAEHPADRLATRNLAFLLARSGRRDEAEAALRRCIERNDHDADLFVDLGFVLLGAGRPTEAAAWFHRALALAPDLQRAREGLTEARR